MRAVLLFIAAVILGFLAASAVTAQDCDHSQRHRYQATVPHYSGGQRIYNNPYSFTPYANQYSTVPVQPQYYSPHQVVPHCRPGYSTVPRVPMYYPPATYYPPAIQFYIPLQKNPYFREQPNKGCK